MDERFFPLIFDAVPVGVFTVDKERRVTSINRTAQDMTGFEGQEALGRPCHEVFCADMCRTSCPLMQSIETGKVIQDQEVVLKTQSGERLPVAVTTAAVRDGNEVIGGVEIFRNLAELVALRKQLARSYEVGDIVSKNETVRALMKALPLYARSSSTVLIEGASGTGKELIARALHNMSPRKAAPWVAVNCAALPDRLLERELFGYVREAFPEATKDKPGRLDSANGGTLFLDEVGTFSPTMQIKLLRVLEAGAFEPLGAEVSKKVDARIVVATEMDLQAEVEAGRFRKDLLYRLNVIHMRLPALSERPEDIPLLARHFIRRFNAVHGKNITKITDQALAKLMQAPFPGNIRELENAIEYAFVVCPGSEIRVSDLPAQFIQTPQPNPEITSDNPLMAAEAAAIRSALVVFEGNRTRAAGSLGISRHTLWRKMKRLGLDTS